MATLNEFEFAKKVANFDDKVKQVQDYIKENFNIESRLDESEAKMHIWTTSIENALQLVAAKQYIEENFDDQFFTVEYGK